MSRVAEYLFADRYTTARVFFSVDTTTAPNYLWGSPQTTVGAYRAMPTTAASQTLLVAFNRVGDLTIATPLFRALARDTELSLLTRPFGPLLLGEQSYVRRMYPLRYPNRGSSPLGNLLLGGHRRTLGRQLARAGFDRVLLFETERGVIKRWLRDLFPGRVTEIPRPAPTETPAAELCRIAAAGLGCDMQRYDPVPALEITPRARLQARERSARLGDRVIGVQMGSQRTHTRRPAGARPDLKTLSPSQWRSLVARLIAEGHADAVAFHGSPSESGMVQRFLRTLPSHLRQRCHDLSTDVGLDLLPAMLAEHRALISVDTGPAHIAAAVGCPLLVCFGPTDPVRFAPRGTGSVEVMLGKASCQFCHNTPLYKTCRDNRCLNRVDDEQLWAAWTRLREQSAPTA